MIWGFFDSDLGSIFIAVSSKQQQAAALIYFKRFYLQWSVMEHQPKNIMLTCIYAACKIEENRVSAEELGKGISQDHQMILNNEMIVYQSLDFDLIVYAPYRSVEAVFVLNDCHAQGGRRKVILEAGCGAGNTIFPVIASYQDAFVYACDFSPRAIELVKTHEDFKESHVHAFVSDLTADDLCKEVIPSSVDIVTMMFMLSAVSPEKMPLVLQNVKKVLKPNGYVLFRDYATGDLAQASDHASEPHSPMDASGSFGASNI